MCVHKLLKRKRKKDGYLKKFFRILQKIKAIFDPASGNFGSLLQQLFTFFTFSLTFGKINNNLL